MAFRDIPWFMHMVDGPDGRHNSLTGVYATPKGVYVRTWAEKTRSQNPVSLEITFYPLETERREAIRVFYQCADRNDISEDEASAAVRQHQESVGQ